MRHLAAVLLGGLLVAGVGGTRVFAQSPDPGQQGAYEMNPGEVMGLLPMTPRGYSARESWIERRTPPPAEVERQVPEEPAEPSPDRGRTTHNPAQAVPPGGQR